MKSQKIMSSQSNRSRKTVGDTLVPNLELYYRSRDPKTPWHLWHCAKIDRKTNKYNKVHRHKRTIMCLYNFLPM